MTSALASTDVVHSQYLAAGLDELPMVRMAQSPAHRHGRR